MPGTMLSALHALCHLFSEQYYEIGAVVILIFKT